MTHDDRRSGRTARATGMTIGTPGTLGALAALLLLGACIDSGGDRILGVDATATVTGTVRLDANGNGQLDEGEAGIPGVRIRLRFAGTSSVLDSEPSDAAGVLAMEDVPVGTYQLEVDAAGVGDSLEIAEVTHSDLILGADAVVDVGVRLSFPTLTVADARAAQLGRRIFVQGVVLNSRTSFGDNTVHITGADAAIRTTQPGAVTLAPGDSVRVLGTRASLDGQPTLDKVSFFALGPGTMPIAPILPTGTVATADGGTRDAALVRVTDAMVLERTATAAGFELRVDDGSGPLVVRLDAVTPFPVQNYGVGAVVDVRGVLVPTQEGDWAMRPRVLADVVVITPPPPPGE